ncbi:beta-1,4-glucuronyltransferase 1-like [Onthophagus taurus]|uniref:beta-1,4-glucuronyltransferase 1-like n=1 Tax=Onthophagus taurus TaxID=166361 RepID=UPI000C209C6C|nr:beta-1,4-glucuronyltransferase 1-like [Onthophagus taurus]
MMMIVNKRLFVAKCCVILLAGYFFVYVVTSSGTSGVIRTLQQSGRNLAAIDQTQTITDRIITKLETPQQKTPTESLQTGSPTQSTQQITEPQQKTYIETTTISKWDEAEMILKNGLKCVDRPKRVSRQQRGDYWVLYNYVQADESYECHTSVTYTTHADYSFLDNLVPLAERWSGPISIALHAPGSDFKPTLDSIRYLRDCTKDEIKRYVTFHIYFSTKHIPSEIPKVENLLTEPFNCSLPAPFFNVSNEQMYKTQKKLLYPVNVGRNIARESAETHFILASDIELYPSKNIIKSFLEMIAFDKDLLQQTNLKVFTLHLFEVGANQVVPENKTQLQDMLKNSMALPFHKKLCPLCHNVPKSKEWQTANETDGLHVFHVGKRTGKFVHWEPIFIGTHNDPLYDERLSWEGKRDKMTQGYALCVLNYDFMILDNAFLVHRPGIKVYKKDSKRLLLSAKTNQLINKIIYPELKVIYGVRKGCAV